MACTGWPFIHCFQMELEFFFISFYFILIYFFLLLLLLLLNFFFLELEFGNIGFHGGGGGGGGTATPNEKTSGKGRKPSSILAHIGHQQVQDSNWRTLVGGKSSQRSLRKVPLIASAQSHVLCIWGWYENLGFLIKEGSY